MRKFPPRSNAVRSRTRSVVLSSSMPLDNDETSALSKPELRVSLNECRQAQAERVAQHEEMTAGAAATDNDAASFYAAQIGESETAIQKLDTDMASLGMAMRERASPAKTRPPAPNSEPTSKSQTADMASGESLAFTRQP